MAQSYRKYKKSLPEGVVKATPKESKIIKKRLKEKYPEQESNWLTKLSNSVKKFLAAEKSAKKKTKTKTEEIEETHLSRQSRGVLEQLDETTYNDVMKILKSK